MAGLAGLLAGVTGAAGVRPLTLLLGEGVTTGCGLGLLGLGAAAAAGWALLFGGGAAAVDVAAGWLVLGLLGFGALWDTAFFVPVAWERICKRDDGPGWKRADTTNTLAMAKVSANALSANEERVFLLVLLAISFGAWLLLARFCFCGNNTILAKIPINNACLPFQYCLC